eukprot:m.57211 g.57211  ORF g.57211 m.57211 type:complete len:815 (-) comp12096_c0_seq1:53-2497(-)
MAAAEGCETPQAFISLVQGTLKDLDGVTAFAIDIGGSLAKLAYYAVHSETHTTFRPDPPSPGHLDAPPLYSAEPADQEVGRLHFAVFETKYISTCLDFIKSHVRALSTDTPITYRVNATGGGAHKYAQLFQEKLGVNFKKMDEMLCLCRGVNFLLNKIPNEAFTFRQGRVPQHHFRHVSQNIFPYLLVNIGSGVSIVRVDSETQYTRVDGSAVGGGTFWGLASLLTAASDFNAILDLAHDGDSRSVDMLVGDIYGGAAPASLGLDNDLLASSFGKAARSARDPAARHFSERDIAKSLLDMISNNIGQIACLNARLYGLKRIYFGGFFIRGRPMTMNKITLAVDYWGKGEIDALFLRHEGYIGAIGALLAESATLSPHPAAPAASAADPAAPAPAPDAANPSVALPTESFTSPPRPLIPVSRLQGSSWSEKFTLVPVTDTPALVGMFQLDHRPRLYGQLPLLQDQGRYRPDLEDLIADAEARQYWLALFEESASKFAELAAKSESNSVAALQRAEAFRRTYLEHLHILSSEPSAYGELSVRSMLDLREQCLREFRFADMYWLIKREENAAALAKLASWLSFLDAMPWPGRQRAVVAGLLAGNCFDWGSKETASRMESGSLDFHGEWKRVHDGAWAVDHLEAWVDLLTKKPPRRAVIFVDNSGADIVLGVLPFVRELLRLDCSVIIAANSVPVLNDVTHEELQIMLPTVARLCPILCTALESGKLSSMQSGSSSACIDLQQLDQDLCDRCADCDLIIIEGMGRAIHTNYTTRFTRPCVKVALLKNSWLARRLGFNLYDSIFQLELPADDASHAQKD